ncbi:MAG TPA: response regulator transcription factor [Anaerovoracaceae bacterium]|nr:response regulator transcription factor [Anaerovoracaceae bacterium]
MKLEPKKVLVVEDEAKISEVIKSFLESKGFVVLVAENGRQAFGLIDKENISLIILDLMLPDMSGEEICMKIRKTSRVPIIMVTAKADEEDMLKGLGIGADDYITKPFSLKELFARIEVVLRRSSDDLIPLYNKNSFLDGDLEVDFQSRTIKKQGREVSLTPNEYKILAAMIKYPNKVFTREELIQTALGDEFEGFDRAIDSHIKNIRQKIETDTKNPDYLITIHGTGYKFGEY